MRRKIVLVILAFLLSAAWAYAEEVIPLPKLTVFFSPGCHKCIEAKKKLIPEIEREFQDRITIEYRDIDNVDNYKLLLSLREKYQLKRGISLPEFFFAGQFFSQDQIQVALRQARETQAAEQNLPEIDLIARFRSFAPLAIISAGLIDGINPCAFTVIVFFLSFLALQGYRKRELIVIGLTFIFAVFLTYLLVGLGLFGFLYQLSGFWFIMRVFNLSLGVFCVILGLLALHDYFIFKKSKSTEGLALQLPQKIKNRIHSLIGAHYRNTQRTSAGMQKRNLLKLFISALATGFLVSILEAVCTGQVYLPTIAFVLKATHLKIEALGCLLLYNIMFVVPLFIIFLLALLGVGSEQFSSLFKRHLPLVKILMAVLFLGLGIFLIWRL